MGLNHAAATSSPQGYKTFFFSRTESRSQTLQLEARGKKSIVYGQYGRRTKKVNLKVPLDARCVD